MVRCLLAVLLLAGCPRPAGPAPLPTWGPSAPDGAPDRAGEGEAWTPAEVLARVDIAHPEVLSAEAEAEAARAERGAARFWLDPEVEGRVVVGPDGDAEGEGALVVRLPLAGAGAAEARVATFALHLARWDEEVARRRARREVRSLLASLAHARAREGLLGTLAERSAAYAELAAQRRAAAVADPLDVSLVLADAARDRRAALEASERVLHLEADLRALVALGPAARVADPGLGRARLDESGDLVEEARRGGDAWVRAHLEARVAEGRLLAARLDLAPDLRVGPAVVAGPDGTALGAEAGLGVPLLGGQGARARAARARARGARIRLGGEARRSAAHILAGLQRLEALEAQQAELEGPARAAAGEAFDLARARYEAGRLDVLLLLSAHRAHAELETEILDLRLAHLEATLELEALVGRPMRTAPVQEDTP